MLSSARKRCFGVAEHLLLDQLDQVLVQQSANLNVRAEVITAAAAAVTAEATVSKRRAHANDQTGDDLLASSMDGDGRGGEKKKQRRDRRGKRGKQEKSRREEGSLQSMIENYSKDKIFPLANSPHACCGVCRNEVLLMMR